jgi:hypothetical protein
MSYWHTKLSYSNRRPYYECGYRVYFGKMYICHMWIGHPRWETMLEFKDNKRVFITYGEDPSVIYIPKEVAVTNAFILLKGTEKLWHYQIPATVATKAKLLGSTLNPKIMEVKYKHE